MPKFNRPSPARTPDTVTHEGGPGFTRDAKDELFLLGVANMVGVDTFYESGDGRDARFEQLIHQVTRADEKWMQSFIGWLRTDAGVRSASIIAAAEYVRAGGSSGRQVIASVLQRADEPAEMLGYWLNRHGRALPMPVKRGIADAVTRLYTERNTLRYDGNDLAIRFGDVLELCHPRHRNGMQSVLFKHLIDRRHGRGESGADTDSRLPILARDAYLTRLPVEARRAHLTDAIDIGWDWKRLAGWLPGGMTALAWESVIPNMGLMALTRNLRNFDDAGISDQAALKVTAKFLNPSDVAASRQFPLRFLTAWKNVTSMRWGMALEGALNLSLANVPSLPGRTLILVDVSPSMRDHVLTKRTDRRASDAAVPYRWEVAAIFGAALAQRAADAEIVMFDFNPIAQAQLRPSESILRFSEQCRDMANRSNGTDILRALGESYKGHDRVVILTDEQTSYDTGRRPYQFGWGGQTVAGERYGWSDVAHIRCPVYTFNVGGYQPGVTPNERNWHTLGGLTDACFALIPILEGRHKGLWPWESEQRLSVVAD